MIAHLSNVKSNIEYSNGNGTEEKIAAIDEKIKLLEVEQADVANASSQEEFVVVLDPYAEYGIMPKNQPCRRRTDCK